MESLDRCFQIFSDAKFESIRAIAMDMWPPYHIMSSLNEAVDDVRKREQSRVPGPRAMRRSPDRPTLAVRSGASAPQASRIGPSSIGP